MKSPGVIAGEEESATLPQALHLLDQHVDEDFLRGLGV